MTVDITPVIAEGTKLISAYGEGYFRIDDVKYDGDIVVYGDKVLDIAMGDSTNISKEAIDQLLDALPFIELLMIGTGASLHWISAELRQYIRTKGNGTVVEVMDSAAASRTYNALVAEGRKVAVWLKALPVDETSNSDA